MKIKVPIVFLTLFFIKNLYAFSIDDVHKIKNDKEAVISSFSKLERNRVMEKYNSKEREEIIGLFYQTVLEFLNDENKQCEADFYSRIVSALRNADIAHSKGAIEDHLKMLRSTNAIDDVLFDILTSINEDAQNMREVNLSNRPNKLLFLRGNEERLEKNNLQELYSSFKNWPDELSSCSTQEYFRLKEAIVIPNQSKGKIRNKYLATLNYNAYTEGLISLSTYNRLEFFRTKSNLEKRYIWLNDYFKIIFNVKNKMVPRNHNYEVKNLNAEDKFSAERLRRFSRLTRRKILYSKYNETQIILLAQVMQKASRRMGVDPDTNSKPPYLIQEFEIIDEFGERQTYVEKTEIDVQSQYNLARRLLRKDIVDLQMMGIFNNINITYEDLIMASLEVGYISLEDIEFVVKYDDLWNPATPKYERVKNFVFTSLGYSTFFLPPPFNIAASLALGIVEGIVENKNKEGATNDNPGTFIE